MHIKGSVVFGLVVVDRITAPQYLGSERREMLE
jgi:hypothetical protein